MKKRLLIAIIPVAVLLAGPWVVPVVTPWSAINAACQEINIKTGQARYSPLPLVCQGIRTGRRYCLIQGPRRRIRGCGATSRPGTSSTCLGRDQRIWRYTAFHAARAQADRGRNDLCNCLEPDAQRGETDRSGQSLRTLADTRQATSRRIGISAPPWDRGTRSSLEQRTPPGSSPQPATEDLGQRRSSKEHAVNGTPGNSQSACVGCVPRTIFLP